MGLFNRVKKKEDSTDNNNIVEIYNIKFPFYVNLYNKNFDEESGDEPLELKAEEAYRILNKDDIEAMCSDFENSELYKYCNELDKKIANMQMQFVENGFIKIIVYVKESLNDNEKKELLKFISEQMSDGWGEGNFDYLNENEEKYNVIFWKYNDWNIDFI